MGRTRRRRQRGGANLLRAVVLALLTATACSDRLTWEELSQKPLSPERVDEIAKSAASVIQSLGKYSVTGALLGRLETVTTSILQETKPDQITCVIPKQYRVASGWMAGHTVEILSEIPEENAYLVRDVNDPDPTGKYAVLKKDLPPITGGRKRQKTLRRKSNGT